MRYEIEPNGAAENWFNIEESTGEISVKQKIDREDDSVQSSNGNFQFVVKVNNLLIVLHFQINLPYLVSTHFNIDIEYVFFFAC